MIAVRWHLFYRQLQDLNLRTIYATDFKSVSLTARTSCHLYRFLHWMEIGHSFLLLETNFFAIFVCRSRSHIIPFISLTLKCKRCKKKVKLTPGFEPGTKGTAILCSTTELCEHTHIVLEPAHVLRNTLAGYPLKTSRASHQQKTTLESS